METLVLGMVVLIPRIRCNTVGNAMGGVGALGDYLPIVGGFVDIGRENERAVDKLKIRNLMKEQIDFQCYLGNGDEKESWKTLLPNDEIEITKTRAYGESYEGYCKFLQKTTNIQVPSVNYGKKCYLVVAIFNRGSRERCIDLKHDAIEVRIPAWESWPDTNIKESNKVLANWKGNGGYGFRCFDKFHLKSKSGENCLNLCSRQSYSSGYSWCYTEKSWDYCDRGYTNYNIRDHANSGILSSIGYPCGTDCAQNGKTYYWCRPKPNFRKGTSNWDYCSPRAGYDYLNRKCDGICDLHGKNYKWCTVGRSWGYCSF